MYISIYSCIYMGNRTFITQNPLTFMTIPSKALFLPSFKTLLTVSYMDDNVAIYIAIVIAQLRTFCFADNKNKDRIGGKNSCF